MMPAGEPGSRLRDCAASADLSVVVVVLYDSSVSVLDMKEQQQRHTLQVCSLCCAVLCCQPHAAVTVLSFTLT